MCTLPQFSSSVCCCAFSLLVKDYVLHATTVTAASNRVSRLLLCFNANEDEAKSMEVVMRLATVSVKPFTHLMTSGIEKAVRQILENLLDIYYLPIHKF
jgi:hypothetical protein